MLDNLLVSRLPAFHSSRCLFTKPQLPSFYPKRSITHPQRKRCQYMELYNSSMTFYNYLNFWVKFFTKICIFVENWQTITNFLSAQDLPGVPAPCCHAIRQLPPPPIDPQKMFPANIATTAANKQTFTRDTPSMIFLEKSLFSENV